MSTMDTLSAFAMNQAAKGNTQRIFDWDKAATLIRERAATETVVASAGLGSDWEWTGGPIYENGSPVPAEDTYTYLASSWATPELDIDGDVVECWRYESDTSGWDAHTYWPPSALAILRGTAADA